MRVVLLILFALLLQPIYGQGKEYLDSLRNSLNEGQDTKSLFYLDTLIQLYPESTDFLLYKGAIFYDQKYYSSAAIQFSKAIEINPDLVDAYVRRGRTYLALEMYDKGIEDLTRAYGKYRYQDSAIFLYRAYAYHKTDDEAAAKLDYDSALEFSRNENDLPFSQALVEIEMSDFKEALANLNQSLAIDTNDITAIEFRSMVNLQLGKLDESLADAKRCLKEKPHDPRVNFTMGVIYFDKRDFKTSLEFLKNSRDIRNKFENYWLSAMANYYLVNDQKAIDDFKMFLTFSIDQKRKSQAHYLIGICKNNMKAGTGCADIAEAISEGLSDAKRTFSEDCQ